MKRIIDSRKKEKFMIDDEYMNGQAKLCGWQATIVYLSLCRHANIDQECFPSIKLIAEENGVNRKTVLKGLEKLQERNLITIEKKRSKGGQWLNNTYILLDKSQWDYSQVPVEDMGNQVPVVPLPCPSQGLNQVPLKDTKETHNQGNTFKETHTLEKNQKNLGIPNGNQRYSKEEKRREKKGAKKDIILPDWLDQEKWKEWLQYRKERKLTCSKMTLDRQIKLLEQNKKDHKDIIERSITNGWQGLFPRNSRKSTNALPVTNGKYDHLS